MTDEKEADVAQLSWGDVKCSTVFNGNGPNSPNYDFDKFILLSKRSSLAIVQSRRWPEIAALSVDG